MEKLRQAKGNPEISTIRPSVHRSGVADNKVPDFSAGLVTA